MTDQEHTPEPWIDIVFDGPPSHESGRFVEVENSKRESICFGEWVERDDGYWCLRINAMQGIRNPQAIRELVEAARAVMQSTVRTRDFDGKPVLDETAAEHRAMFALGKALAAPDAEESI